MKIIREQILINAGGFSATAEWNVIHKDVITAIKKIEWPPGSGSFTLYPESGKKTGEGNGVVPIKRACMTFLESKDWQLETRLDIATLKVPGPIDATTKIDDKLFCLEWETGNISSSHRALNKMALGMLKGILIGGMLILPVRNMAQYLTDRIGNYEELEPYFPLWESLNVPKGLLSIVAIEHDGLSADVPRIKKGTDGRARA